MLTARPLVVSGPVNAPLPPALPGRLRRAAAAAGDVLGVMALLMCIPFVILAVGIPIALVVQLLLWVVRQF